MSFYGLLLTDFRRLHVCQDQRYIYINFAEYSKDYINYLKGKNYSDDTFIVMHEFGPWDTLNVTLMRHVAVILIAICLRANKDSADEGKDLWE